MNLHPTKAYLLAAGLGTRLRPLTESTPKCLVPIGGRPLLSIWMDICERLGISEALINTHHLPDQVENWARVQKSRVRVTLAYEEVLRGSAGTLAANRQFVGEDRDFYIFYADNLVHADLTILEPVHARHAGVLTMGVFRTPKPSDCGIATLEECGRISSFEEKPARPRSDLANAGIYLARSALFDHLPQDGFADFGTDVLPKLVGLMWGRLLDGYLVDIGTHENYQRALAEWPTVVRRNLGRVMAAPAAAS